MNVRKEDEEHARITAASFMPREKITSSELSTTGLYNAPGRSALY